MKHFSRHLIVFAALYCTAITASHAAPPLMSYQGRLTDNVGDPLNGVYSITFAIYDNSGPAIASWSENHAAVNVNGGLFSVELGSVVPIPEGLFKGSDRYLGITVGADPEISPRTRFTTVAYAFRVASVDSASGGTIAGNVKVNANSGDDGLEVTQLGLGRGASITVDNVFSTANGLDISMQGTGAGISIAADGGPAINVTGAFGDGSIILPGQSISGNEIVNGTITDSHLAANSVGSSQIQIGAVGKPEIAAGGVGSSEIEDNSITAADIGTNEVGTSEIAANAVVSGNIADLGILTQDIGDNQVTSAKIQGEAGGLQNVSNANFAIDASIGSFSSDNINAPISGHVLVIATMELTVAHVTGTESTVMLGVSESNSSLDSDQQRQWTIPSNAPSAIYREIISTQKIFPVNAGSTTFYMVGDKLSGASDFFVTHITMSSLFFPTTYGNVDQ